MNDINILARIIAGAGPENLLNCSLINKEFAHVVKEGLYIEYMTENEQLFKQTVLVNKLNIVKLMMEYWPETAKKIVCPRRLTNIYYGYQVIWYDSILVPVSKTDNTEMLRLLLSHPDSKFVVNEEGFIMAMNNVKLSRYTDPFLVNISYPNFGIIVKYCVEHDLHLERSGCTACRRRPTIHRGWTIKRICTNDDLDLFKIYEQSSIYTIRYPDILCTLYRSNAIKIIKYLYKSNKPVTLTIEQTKTLIHEDNALIFQYSHYDLKFIGWCIRYAIKHDLRNIANYLLNHYDLSSEQSPYANGTSLNKQQIKQIYAIMKKFHYEQPNSELLHRADI